VGIASSASAFSALALSASSAAKLKLSQKELSILARRGSGSASRSVVDGFAIWKKGKNSRASFAKQLAPVEHWDLRDLVVIVGKSAKKKSSNEGHALVLTSPFFKVRQRNLPRRIREIKKAIKAKNMINLGELVEEEAIELHVIAMSSKPSIIYWNKGTMEVINKVKAMREDKIQAYFTMDAGPNVHIICRAKHVKKIASRVRGLREVKSVITNKPAIGTRLINRHLF
jgi:diphosphomevalonate decarboxylase